MQYTRHMKSVANKGRDFSDNLKLFKYVQYNAVRMSSTICRVKNCTEQPLIVQRGSESTKFSSSH